MGNKVIDILSAYLGVLDMLHLDSGHVNFSKHTKHEKELIAIPCPGIQLVWNRNLDTNATPNHLQLAFDTANC